MGKESAREKWKRDQYQRSGGLRGDAPAFGHRAGELKDEGDQIDHRRRYALINLEERDKFAVRNQSKRGQGVEGFVGVEAGGQRRERARSVGARARGGGKKKTQGKNGGGAAEEGAE